MNEEESTLYRFIEMNEKFDVWLLVLVIKTRYLGK